MKHSPEEIVDNIDRREFLKGAGIAGGAAGAVGIVWYSTRDDAPDDEPFRPEPPEEPPEEEPPEEEPPEEEPPEEEPPEEEPPEEEIPYAEEFETVVDATEEGARPDGSEPVNFLFDEYSGDDTLFAFDPGEYQLDPLHLAGRSRIGIVRTEEDDTRFVPNDGGCRGGHPYVFFEEVSDLLVDGVKFDFRNSDSGGPLHLFLHGESRIEDVTYLGTCSNQLGIARIEVLDPEGSAHIERLEARNVDGNNDLTGVYVSDAHAGDLTFEDCRLDGFSDNGLYASAPGGPNGNDGSVNVIGGTYRNNNIANVRLGATGSVAERVTVVVDSETYGWGQLNSRGIRLRNSSEQEIRNCEITFGREAADSFGGIVFHAANGGALVEGTTIQIDRDRIPAVRAFPPEGNPESGPVFENVSVTGDASGGEVANIEGRDGTVFRQCVIEQRGSDRSGLRFQNARNCRIVDCQIEVDREPFVLENASATVENTTVVTSSGEETFDDVSVENETVTL